MWLPLVDTCREDYGLTRFLSCRGCKFDVSSYRLIAFFSNCGVFFVMEVAGFFVCLAWT